MQISEDLIRNVVTQVIQEVRGNHQTAAGANAGSSTGSWGLFDDADQAVRAARQAFEQLRTRPMEDRQKAIAHIRRISMENAELCKDFCRQLTICIVQCIQSGTQLK